MHASFKVRMSFLAVLLATTILLGMDYMLLGEVFHFQVSIQPERRPWDRSLGTINGPDQVVFRSERAGYESGLSVSGYESDLSVSGSKQDVQQRLDLFPESPERDENSLVEEGIHGQPRSQQLLPDVLRYSRKRNGPERTDPQQTESPVLTTFPVLRYEDGLKKLEGLRKYYTMKGVNCSAIFHSNWRELKGAGYLRERLKRRPGVALDEDFYKNAGDNCPKFLKDRGYIDSPLTQEEAEFPIAFSIVIYKDIEMFERLLRSIYRPQNYYCVHVDIKASYKFFQAVEKILKCFPNVLWAPKWLDVEWGTFSVLESEILCLKALWKFRWKYFINLTGQEFPLQTNAFLVKILKAFNGSNDAYGSVKKAIPNRWKGKIPPHGIQLTKGQVHIAASREFVDFILHNKTALDFLAWTRETEVPDETFFSTLNHNPGLGVPGAYTGEMDQSEYFSVCRYKNWRNHIEKRCAGKYERKICILSSGDLGILSTRHELFANKFYLHDDRVAIGCLEERHFNNTLDDFLGKRFFDSDYYENLEFVKHHAHL